MNIEFLRCKDCNTVHAKWIIRTPMTVTVSSSGNTTRRKNLKNAVLSCPLDSNHKNVDIIYIFFEDGNREKREKKIQQFMSYFKPITKEDKNKYKGTYMEGIKYIRLDDMTAQEAVKLLTTTY